VFPVFGGYKFYTITNNYRFTLYYIYLHVLIKRFSVENFARLNLVLDGTSKISGSLCFCS
jgi:hypothetical protein